MFTGIVEGTGRVIDLRLAGGGADIAVETPLAGELSVGDSIAVEGVCLTVTSQDAQSFRADIVATTLDRTTLGVLHAGQRVNLERPLRLQDRLGGHLVTGHVDGVGHLRARSKQGETVRFQLEATPEGAHYLVDRGSIAVAGVSLTIVEAEGLSFSVALIPTTLALTTLDGLAEGAPVNLEYDLVAKYVWHWTRGAAGRQNQPDLAAPGLPHAPAREHEREGSKEASA